MHKKIDINELDIPQDDVEAWDRYPKHHWVYDLSRLLDAQHIKWSPFRTETFTRKIVNMKIESQDPWLEMEPAFIFIKEPEGNEVITEVYITKGEIKLMRHIDKKTRKEIQGVIGEIELRLNAFATLHFQKFTGVITTESVGSDLFSIRLRPYSELAIDTNTEVVKLTKRIYKKLDMHVVGPTDQVYRESIAS